MGKANGPISQTVLAAAPGLPPADVARQRQSDNLEKNQRAILSDLEKYVRYPFGNVFEPQM